MVTKKTSGRTKYYVEEEVDHSQPEDLTEKFAHRAFGIVGKGRDYKKVVIKYNLKTMTAEIESVSPFADTMANAIYKIKEIFTRKLMLGEEIK